MFMEDLLWQVVFEIMLWGFESLTVCGELWSSCF